VTQVHFHDICVIPHILFGILYSCLLWI